MLEAIRQLDAPPVILAIFEQSGRVPLGARSAIAARLTASDFALAEVQPNGAVIELTWEQFDDRITATVRWLRARGVSHGARVAICLPNGVDHIVATHAAWRLGATVAPVDSSLALNAKKSLLRGLAPLVVVDQRPDLDSLPSEQPTDFAAPLFGLPNPYAILPTGGTTGHPRLAVQSATLWGRFDMAPTRLGDVYGVRLGQVQLVSAPLGHGFAFGYAHAFGLAYGHQLILSARFDPEMALQSIERYGVQYMAIVPTMMKRIADCPRFSSSNLSTLEAVLHAGAPCPPRLKRRWMERIGPELIYEAYGATDISLTCVIRGDEWLKKPGSLGSPLDAEIRIFDSEGAPVEVGRTGDIWVRPKGSTHHPDILGPSKPSNRAGFRPTGDRGYVDSDGYLYLEGRSDGAINVGGNLIYPEDVESILMEHSEVRDAAVVGIPDNDLGEHIEAIVELAPGWDDAVLESILTWCADRCSSSERPRSIRVMNGLPRSSAGKLLRAKLTAFRDRYDK